MKRPFALIGITYLSVQAALFYLESDLAAAILTAVCFIGTIVSLFILKNRNLRHTVLGFCLTAAFASTIFSGYNIFVKQPIVDKYSEREIYVTATVLEQPTVQYDTYRYLIETDSINGKIEKRKICLSTINELNVEEFDRISCVLPLKECTKSQMIADGAFLQASVNKNFAYIVKKTDDKPLYYQAVKIRENFADSFEQNMSQDCASLCRAVLLGEKTALSQEIQNDFTRCGVSFLIVVSGMHLAIISSFVFLCIKKIIKTEFAFDDNAYVRIFIYGGNRICTVCCKSGSNACRSVFGKNVYAQRRFAQFARNCGFNSHRTQSYSCCRCGYAFIFYRNAWNNIVGKKNFSLYNGQICKIEKT